jgi:hypothetical protein
MGERMRQSQPQENLPEHGPEKLREHGENVRENGQADCTAKNPGKHIVSQSPSQTANVCHLA